MLDDGISSCIIAVCLARCLLNEGARRSSEKQAITPARYDLGAIATNHSAQQGKGDTVAQPPPCRHRYYTCFMYQYNMYGMRRRLVANHAEAATTLACSQHMQQRRYAYRNKCCSSVSSRVTPDSDLTRLLSLSSLERVPHSSFAYAQFVSELHHSSCYVVQRG